MIKNGVIMIKNYTVQFSYKGKEYSCPVQSCHKFKPTQRLDDIANAMAKGYLEKEDLLVEGVIFEKLRLYGKDGELLYSMD